MSLAFCRNNAKQTSWAPRINLSSVSSQGLNPLVGTTLQILKRAAVHPGTVTTDFRRGLRPRVLTYQPGDRWAIHVISCSDEHEVIGTGRLPYVAIPKEVRAYCCFRSSCKWVLQPYLRAAFGERKTPHILIVLCWNAEPCFVNTAMIHSSRYLVLLLTSSLYSDDSFQAA